jgi:hypothetical protein
MRPKLDLVIFNRQREKIFYFGKFPFGSRGVEKPNNTVMIAFRLKVYTLSPEHTQSPPRL